MLHILVLLADHIGMALEDHRVEMFAARRSRLLDHHVIEVIHSGFQPQLGSKVQQIFTNRLLIARTTGNGADLLKIPEHIRRFTVFDYIFHLDTTSCMVIIVKSCSSTGNPLWNRDSRRGS